MDNGDIKMTDKKIEVVEEVSHEQPKKEVVVQAKERKPSLQAGGKIQAIAPKDLDEAWRYSTTVVKAKMVPDSLLGGDIEETTAKVMMVINKGMEVGLPPQSALANIMIVNNRPSLWGDGALALVQNSGKLEWLSETIEGKPNTDEWTAICRMKRKDNDQIIEKTFSFGQAKRARLTSKSGPWRDYPERMLQMRARAFAIRDGFADVLQGLSIAEEQQDIPQKTEKVDTTFLDDAPEEAPKNNENTNLNDNEIEVIDVETTD